MSDAVFAGCFFFVSFGFFSVFSSFGFFFLLEAGNMRHIVYLLFIVLMGTLASLNILAGLFCVLNVILISGVGYIV